MRLKLTQAFESGARWLWHQMTDAKLYKQTLKNIRAEARRRWGSKRRKP